MTRLRQGERLCCIHIPGNRQCPAVAVYVVVWEHNHPDAYETDPPSYRELRRPVCPSHLEAAIWNALETCPRTRLPRVGIEGLS